MEPRRNEEHEEGATERRREGEKERKSLALSPSLLLSVTLSSLSS
jgi:hypothetical protein